MIRGISISKTGLCIWRRQRIGSRFGWDEIFLKEWFWGVLPWSRVWRRNTVNHRWRGSRYTKIMILPSIQRVKLLDIVRVQMEMICSGSAILCPARWGTISRITAHVASEKAFGFNWTNVTRRFQPIQVLLNQVYEFKSIIKITCMIRVIVSDS